MVIKFGFATHPNSGGSLPIFHLGFTGHFPAVSREMIVKTFRIVLCPFDRRKIVCNFFERGSNKRRAFACDFVRLVRTFFTLVREFLIYILILILILIIIIIIIIILIIIIIIIIIIIGIHRIRAHTIASVCMRLYATAYARFSNVCSHFRNFYCIHPHIWPCRGLFEPA